MVGQHIKPALRQTLVQSFKQDAVLHHPAGEDGAVRRTLLRQIHYKISQCSRQSEVERCGDASRLPALPQIVEESAP